MKNHYKTDCYNKNAKYPRLKMIAIIDSEYGLAKNGEIPWSFAEDLKFFYRKTKNNIVIMGRRTFESLGAPLKNRANYIISKKSYNKNAKGGESVFDHDAFIRMGTVFQDVNCPGWHIIRFIKNLFILRYLCWLRPIIMKKVSNSSKRN